MLEPVLCVGHSITFCVLRSAFYITSLRGWCVALHFYYSLFYSTRFLLNISFLSLLIIQTCSKHRHNIGKLYFDWKFWKKKKFSGKNFGQHQSFFYSDSILNFAVTQPNLSGSSPYLLWFIWLMKLEHEHTLSKWFRPPMGPLRDSFHKWLIFSKKFRQTIFETGRDPGKPFTINPSFVMVHMIDKVGWWTYFI